MMKKTFLFIIILFYSFTAFNQEQDIDYVEATDSTVFRPHQNTEKSKKINAHISLDMSCAFSSGGFYGTGYNITPYMSYPVNEKISLFAGASIGRYNIYSTNFSDENSSQMLPMTRMYLFAGGNYRVSDKLVVSGTAYKQINDVPNLNSESNNNNINTDLSGFSIGFNYQITPGLSIGAQFRTNSGYPAYNPFMAGGYLPYNSVIW